MAKGFADQLKSELENVYNKKTKGFKDAVFELCSDVIKTTPVDKGDAVSSWTPSVGVKKTRVIRTGNEPAEDTSTVQTRKNTYVAQKQQELFAELENWNPLTESFYFVNTIEYIADLEDGMYSRGVETQKTTAAGFSKQAPAGMVRIHVNDWEQYLKKNNVNN